MKNEVEKMKETLYRPKQEQINLTHGTSEQRKWRMRKQRNERVKRKEVK